MILRPGYVTQKMLEEVANQVDVDKTILDANCHLRPKAPGMRYRHYAPKGDLTIIEGAQDAVKEAICEKSRQATADGHRVGTVSYTHLSYDGVKTARSARVHKRDQNGDIMLTEKRQEEIVRLVYERESITVAELKEILHSSESTIRRDIIALDQEGRLTKVFGGAIALRTAPVSYTHLDVYKRQVHHR